METSSETTKQRDKLNSLIGSWEGTTLTWFEPGKDPVKAANKATFKPALNENFVEQEYESSLEGKPFHGKALYAYDSSNEKFQCSWIDSFHMSSSIMFSEGNATEKGFSVLGAYFYEKIRWGWRTEFEISSKDEIKITAYNITPEGEDFKALETVYKRVK
jgi:hypothetical protein